MVRILGNKEGGKRLSIIGRGWTEFNVKEFMLECKTHSEPVHHRGRVRVKGCTYVRTYLKSWHVYFSARAMSAACTTALWSQPHGNMFPCQILVKKWGPALMPQTLPALQQCVSPYVPEISINVIVINVTDNWHLCTPQLFLTMGKFTSRTKVNARRQSWKTSRE